MLIRLIYSTLLTLVSPFFLYSLYKKKEGKPSVGKRWKEHFGLTPKLSNTYPLWIHAVSVGEVIAVSPLIKEIKRHSPEQGILLTTTTSTGAEQAAKLDCLVEHRYMPLDFSFAINSFLKKTQPSQLLIMETELWPNTIHCVARAGINITVINARLSQRSADRYSKVSAIFNLLTKDINKILCQHQDDAQRFIKLGIAKSKVEVTGSIKFDITISQQLKEQSYQLRNTLGSKRPIWIAASTHQGEDEQVLAAHQEILKVIPEALLILVPRHPERFNAVYSLTGNAGFNVIKRSQKAEMSKTIEVYLVDTMGEMLILLGAADICFMGGSLIGNKVGGHNLLEPAAIGLPTITGPSFFNFTDITKQLCNANATTIINNSSELNNQVIHLLTNKEQQEQQGKAALNVVQENQGAITKTLHYLQLL